MQNNRKSESKNVASKSYIEVLFQILNPSKKMKPFLILLFIISKLTCFGQKDQFSAQALEFTKQLTLKTDSIHFNTFLSDSLINEEFFKEVELIRTQIKPQEMAFHIAKVSRDLLLYTIVVDNKQSAKQLGEFRVLFEDNSDLLIDKWMFTEPENSLEEFDYPEDVPPPTVPAPRK